MKKWFFISMVLIWLMTACDFFSNGNSGNSDKPEPPEEPSQKTVIVFDNTDGTCAAVIYNSNLRTEESIITEVPAGQLSKEIEYSSGSSVPFYFSYNINLIGINALAVKYIPELGRDQIYMRIDANKKTVITVPPLAQTVSSPDNLLSNNSYLVIQNNSSFSISLQRGISVGTLIQPDNLSDTSVNPGERAHYTLLNSDNRNVSIYQLSENGRYSSFPVPTLNFEAGRVYSFVYNGSSISLFSVLDIKLANTASGSLDDPGNKTFVRFVNENDFSVSVYSNLARNVKFAEAAAQSLTNSLQTDPNISGAVFYPNYNIVIEDITIPYEGGIIVTRIDAEKTAEQPNTVAIHSLEDIDIEEFEKPLTNSAYIKIHNDANTSLSLRYNSSNLIPQGLMSTVINARETVHYIVNAGNASNYSFMRNTVNPISFPVNVTQFESGKLYSFRYDGSALALLTEKPLTIKQAFALSPPENITARTRPSGSIVLNWNKVGLETSYKIYRAEESPDNFIVISSTGNTTYTDNAVVLGNTYYYKVASVKNTLESELSVNYVSAVSEISSLSAPAGLTANVQGHDSILLSWNSVEEASTYLIYRGYSSSNINTYVTATSSTSYMVSGLEEDTGYWFTVSAANDYSESYPSEPVFGKTLIALPPEPPSGLSASVLENNNIQVTWNNVSGVTAYRVYRSNSADGNYSFIGSVASPPYTDSSLTEGNTYYYKVSSVRGTRESELSSSVSVKLIQTVTPPGSTLSQQLAWIANNGGYGTVFDVVVNNNEYLSPTTISTLGRDITVIIRSANAADVKTIQLSSQGHLFSVSNNIILELQDIVLKGISTNDRALVLVSQGGKMVLDEGSKITLNTNTVYSVGNTINIHMGGGIYVDGGELELYDNCEVSQNSKNGNGGGIFVGNRGNVTIYGGLITENRTTGTWGSGGGIFGLNSATIIMNGGTISKNYSAHYGGGVFIYTTVYNTPTVFTKSAALGSSTSGIIYGGAGDNANTAKDGAYAVSRAFGSKQHRNSTLGYYDEISTLTDAGWE